jgi:HSF-type DNA-binding
MQRQPREKPFSTDPTDDDRKPSADDVGMTGIREVKAAIDTHNASSKEVDKTPPGSGLLAEEQAGVDATAGPAVKLPEPDVGMSDYASPSETPPKMDGNHKGPPPGHAFDQMENVDLPKFVKDHKSTLTFPEKVIGEMLGSMSGCSHQHTSILLSTTKTLTLITSPSLLTSQLMLMLIHIERHFTKQGWRLEKAPIAWTSNGRAFIIRDHDNLVNDWLDMFFQASKFTSFKRKLYRWGFRQVQLLNHDLSTIGNRELVFGNENFQRDKKVLLPRMKSITAESLRRQQAAVQKEQRAVEAAAGTSSDAKPEHLNTLLSQQGGQFNPVAGLHPPTPCLPPPHPQQQHAAMSTSLSPSVATTNSLAFALFTALAQQGANNMPGQHEPCVATTTDNSQQTLGVVSNILQGADNATLQQILHNLQEQHRRQQQQEEMVKNIHRMMFPSQQQPAASPLDSTSSQQSMLARMLRQQLGGFGATGGH